MRTASKQWPMLPAYDKALTCECGHQRFLFLQRQRGPLLVCSKCMADHSEVLTAEHVTSLQ